MFRRKDQENGIEQLYEREKKASHEADSGAGIPGDKKGQGVRRMKTEIWNMSC